MSEHNKYPRTYHFRNSPGTTSDDRIAKDASGLVGVPIVISEKMDGGNIDFVKAGVYARSHAIFTQNPWDRKMWEIWENIKDALTDEEIFGENLWAIHKIKYERVRSFFYMFNLRRQDTWASWDDVNDTAFLLDLPTVPILFEGTVMSEKELYELVDFLARQPSALGGEREGVVGRVRRAFDNSEFSQVVQKWVRAGHVTETDKHWTKKWHMGKGEVHQLYWGD